MTSAMQQLGEFLMAPEPKIMPTPGIHPGVPELVYHQRWDAASNSRLSLLRQSPAHMKASIDHPDPDTPAKLLGRAIHVAVLEPDEFPNRYLVAEQCVATKKDGGRCTNAGIVRSEAAWYCGVHGKGKLCAMGPDLSVISADAFETCIRIRDAVHVHSAARQLLGGVGGRAEVSIAWIDPETGILCKARIDGHNQVLPGGVIADVKSTMDASESAFMRSIWDYGYHRQASLYLEGGNVVGLEARHFVNIAVEKEPPYAVGVYRVIESAVEAGRDQLKPLKRRYAECLASGEWPAYPEEVKDIGLPDYAWKSIDNELLGAGR